jgi:hypothetical protein
MANQTGVKPNLPWEQLGQGAMRVKLGHFSNSVHLDIRKVSGGEPAQVQQAIRTAMIELGFHCLKDYLLTQQDDRRCADWVGKRKFDYEEFRDIVQAKVGNTKFILRFFVTSKKDHYYIVMGF